MEKKRIGTVDIIQILLVCFLFSLRLIPQLQYTFTGTTWSLVYQLIFITWVLTTILRSGLWFQKLQGYFLYLFFWLALLTVEFVVFPNTQIGFFGLNLSFWEPLIIYYYYTEVSDDPRLARIIALIAVAMLFYAVIQSIQSVNVNVLAAREASSGRRSEDAILTGNYSFTAAVTILIPLCIGIVLSKQKILVRVIAGLFVGLCAYFIFHCNLMISILCMMFSFVILFLFSKERKISAGRVLVFILGVLVFLLTAFYWREVAINLLTYMRDTIGTRQINERVNNLIYLLRGSMVGNVSSRISLDLLALETFINNPIIGIGPQNNVEIYYLKQLGLHATFFDDLARYGIIGFGVMTAAYLTFFNEQLKRFDRTMGAKTCKAGFATFIFISLLNPTLSANVGIVLFFIFPVINEMLFGGKRNVL